MVLSKTWLTWEDLALSLDWDTLRRLRPYLTHTDFAGQACIEAERLKDLLDLFELEQQTAQDIYQQ